MSRFEKKRRRFIVSIAFLSHKNTIATIKAISVAWRNQSIYLRKLFLRKIIYLNPLNHKYEVQEGRKRSMFGMRRVK